MLEEKMNYANVTHHLCKSLKANFWHIFPFQLWQQVEQAEQAEKPASFELAFRQLKLAGCL